MNQVHPPQTYGAHKPAPISGCPPGLEYLTQLDFLLLQQEVSLLEGRGGKPNFSSQKSFFYSSDISGLIQDRFKIRTGSINRFTNTNRFHKPVPNTNRFPTPTRSVGSHTNGH
ncbi:hypothetical protein BpHYR1_003451 [Brachionus plicatilis]|uniref:Uncharacterized protein n=1 Tax=Brachionus plicatilis TaxID=10195 RepID=A0A3M7TAQ0_BRAPC|nr:hypothetical protein BpHYR1_003451 [Brachionus plicatilis]